MRYYNPPHKAHDEAKLASLIEAMRNGVTVTPVVVIGDAALTGSHRCAASIESEVALDTVEVSELDYLRACYVCDCQVHQESGELNLFVAALYEVTEDEELKAAINDQRHDYEDMSSFADQIAEAREMSEEELRDWRGW